MQKNGKNYHRAFVASTNNLLSRLFRNSFLSFFLLSSFFFVLFRFVSFLNATSETFSRMFVLRVEFASLAFVAFCTLLILVANFQMEATHKLRKLATLAPRTVLPSACCAISRLRNVTRGQASISCLCFTLVRLVVSLTSLRR